MYKEINVDDKTLFEANGLATEPQGNMTLEEAYDFVMDKVRAIIDFDSSPLRFTAEASRRSFGGVIWSVP